MAKFLTDKSKVLVPVAWDVRMGFYCFSVNLYADSMMMMLLLWGNATAACV